MHVMDGKWFGRAKLFDVRPGESGLVGRVALLFAPRRSRPRARRDRHRHFGVAAAGPAALPVAVRRPRPGQPGDLPRVRCRTGQAPAATAARRSVPRHRRRAPGGLGCAWARRGRRRARPVGGDLHRQRPDPHDDLDGRRCGVRHPPGPATVPRRDRCGDRRQPHREPARRPAGRAARHREPHRAGGVLLVAASVVLARTPLRATSPKSCADTSPASRRNCAPGSTSSRARR